MINNHIHLATIVGGSPEFAPIYSWKVVDYVEEPQVIMSIRRTSKAKLRFHVIENASGPVQLMNFKLTLKMITDDTRSGRDYLNLLKQMNGREVYYVDIDHVAEGEDHTADVKTMRLVVDRVKPQNTMLNYYLVDISLEDNFTV